MRDISGWQTRIGSEEVSARRSRGEWRDRTLAEDARDHANARPNLVCIQNEDGAGLCYGQAFNSAQRLAVALSDWGLGPGDVVSFQLPNWVEVVVIDIAACMLGLVINPITPIYRNAEVGFILKDCRAKVIFIPESFRGFDYLTMLDSLKSSLPDLVRVVVVRECTRDGVVTFTDLIRIEGDAKWAIQRPEAVKLVMYTSGTTGRPKGVLHTHETLPRFLQNCVEVWKLDGGDVLMASPVTHITGYGFGVEMPFYHGTRTVLMEKWNANEAVTLIDGQNIKVTIGATPFLQELVDAAERAGSRLPSLKIFACGGASVPPSLVNRANELFANGRACRVYGSTEAPMTTVGFVAGHDTLAAAAETDGEVFDYDVEIVDEADLTVPKGAAGEITVCGPALFVGYTDAEETAKSFTPAGSFRTGDVGTLTLNNALVITTRKKDLIIRGGENISAREIEDALHRYPGLREASVVSMPHQRLGETVCAFIIPISLDDPPTIDRIRDHLEGLKLAKQKYPEWIEIVEDFPRTASGKVKKDTLRQIIASKVFDPVHN